VTVCVALVAAFVYEPYLSMRSAGTLHSRVLRVFMPWKDLRPDGRFFYGVVLLVLAAAGLALGRPLSGRDPRWPVAAAAALILLLATTGKLYRLLAAWIPGLDVLRNPGGLHLGTHLALCILSGYGAAGLLRRVPLRGRTAAAAALVALAAIDVLRPPLLGLHPPLASRAVDVRPDPEAIAFYGRLASLGNAGPVLEVPIYPGNVRGTTEAVLLSAYHHRRTSACYNSYAPPEVERVRALAAQLPEPSALSELREQGFTTVVVHHPPGRISGLLQLRALAGLAGEEGGRQLVRIAGTRSLTAFAIRAEPASASGGG
jgi:hypothetical protein